MKSESFFIKAWCRIKYALSQWVKSFCIIFFILFYFCRKPIDEAFIAALVLSFIWFLIRLKDGDKYDNIPPDLPFGTEY